MKRCARCPSYAINDDPTETLCDNCWRDAKLETLRAEILAVLIHLDALAETWGDVIGDGGQFHFRRCRVRLRALAMASEPERKNDHA